jgi:transcriptional antiterminator NusG
MDGVEKEEREPVPSEEREKEQEQDLNLPSTGMRLSCEETRRSITGGKDSEFSIRIHNEGGKKQRVKVHVTLTSMTELKEDAPEWPTVIEVDGVEHELPSEEDFETDVSKDDIKRVKLIVKTPHGVRYGDRVEAHVTATSVKDMLVSDSITLATIAKQAILAIKTSIGHEKAVADSLTSRAKQKNIGVFSVLCPEKLRGYVIVEAMNIDRLSEIVRGIKRARGIVEGEMAFDEIQHYLTPKPVVSGISEGDIVELISGPFKGEKARVQSIDESKEEITVELFEAMVPIPVTVSGNSVRVLEKEGRE